MTNRMVFVCAALLLTLAGCAKSETAPAPAEQSQPAAAATTETTATTENTATDTQAEATAGGPCSLVDAADLTAVAGPDAKCENVSEEQARVGKRNFAQYDVYVKKNAEREIADTKQFMGKLTPITGIGDEGYTNEQQNAIYARKGDKYLHVSASGVMPTAPKPYKEGVRYLAERVVAKL